MLDNSKNGIASGLFWKFGERFFAQGVSFAVSIVLARVLTPQDFGLVAMVMIFITFADVFVVSGFSTALIQNKSFPQISRAALVQNLFSHHAAAQQHKLPRHHYSGKHIHAQQ